MELYCVYRIVNFRDGKVYVGKTVDRKIRRRSHFAGLRRGDHPNKHLQHAYNLYGKEAFYFEVLETDIPKELIDQRERYWIAHFDSFNNGYNVTEGGEIGFVRSIPCVWEGIEYPSRSAAARANNTPVETFTAWINAGYKKLADVVPQSGRRCAWNGVEYQTMADAARALQIPLETMFDRLKRGHTCDADMAGTSKRVTWNGVEYPSISAAAKANGLSKYQMSYRLNRGYTCEADMPETQKACTWEGVTYSSIQEAAIANNVTRGIMKRKLKAAVSVDIDLAAKLIEAVETVKG